jgi:hypothetical protein
MEAKLPFDLKQNILFLISRLNFMNFLWVFNTNSLILWSVFMFTSVSYSLAWKCGTVQILGNDYNKTNAASGGNYEEI